MLRTDGFRYGWRRLVAVTAALMVVVCVASVTTRPVAAAGCYGSSCAGYDPQYEGCPVTSTVSTPVMAWQNGRYVQLATVWNRYSWYCNANWARAQLASPALNAGDSMYILADSAADHMCYPGPSNTGQTIESCNGTHYGGSAAAYTDMVDGSGTTVATVDLYDVHGNYIESATATQ